MDFFPILTITDEVREGRDYELTRIELGEKVVKHMVLNDWGMAALDVEDFMSWQTYRQLYEDDAFNTEEPF